MFGGKLIGHNDPDHQEKVVKFNELIANCVIYSNACDIIDAANALAAEGHPVDLDDLATTSLYITRTIPRFGNWTLNLTPPAQTPTTRRAQRSPLALWRVRRLVLSVLGDRARHHARDRMPDKK
jgi:hypothetical protein